MSRSFLVRYVNGTCRETQFDDVTSGELIEISASVGINGVNRLEDVKKIQRALNNVPIDSGGPMTPLEVDGLCGEKTKKAIQGFQLKHFGWKGADGRVDPKQITIQKLQEFQSSDRMVKVPQSGRGGRLSANPRRDGLEDNPYVIPLFMHSFVEARSWSESARRVLDSARLALQERISRGREKEIALIKKYFHIDEKKKRSTLATIDRVERIFGNIRMAVGYQTGEGFGGGGCLWPDPTVNNVQGGPYSAFTFYGGWTRRNQRTQLPRMSWEDNYEGPNLRQDTIFIATNNCSGLSLEGFTRLLVHELAHFVGPEVNSPDRIGDPAYHWQGNFGNLTEYQAVRNADSYTFFAGEAHLKREPS